MSEVTHVQHPETRWSLCGRRDVDYSTAQEATCLVCLRRWRPSWDLSTQELEDYLMAPFGAGKVLSGYLAPLPRTRTDAGPRARR